MLLRKLQEATLFINNGSGVIFQPKDQASSYILTAKHVITGSDDPMVTTPQASSFSRLKKSSDGWKEMTVKLDEIIDGVNYFPHPKKDICILKIDRLSDITPLVRFDDIDADREGFCLGGYPSVRRLKKENKSKWFRYDERITIKQETSNGLREAHIPDLPSRNELVGFSGGGMVRMEENHLLLIGIQNKVVDSYKEERLGRVEFTPLQSFDEIVTLYDGKLEKLESTTPSSDITSTLDLDPELRVLYLGDIENIDHYISRTYKDSSKTFIFDFFDDLPKKLEIGDLIASEKKVIILGNPGLGKSSELKKLAIDLWQSGERIPVYKNLKNFTQLSTIEDYLGIDFKGIDNIILILDGIDEIPNVQDFLSKFANFIQKQTLANKNISYLLSCRTNIYASAVYPIPDFKVFYLQDLSPDDSRTMLLHACGDIVDTLEFNSELRVFINNPFQIQILSEYINEHNVLPSNTAEVWEQYILRRLKSDRVDKLAKFTINVPLIKSHSKRVALVNEMMKSNLISEDNLLRVLKRNESDYDQFVKSPLMEKSYDSDNWFFEHRNIQEYFAASALMENDFETIKEFICIAGSDRTHPSLFNTITFLLNLMDKESEEFASLVNLINTSDPIQLFKADSNRMEDIRCVVFKDFFTKECIEKTLWITTKGMSVKEIAYFANNTESYRFLLTVINDASMHFRARISALEILGYFSEDVIEPGALQVYFREMLMQDHWDLNIKTHILFCIYRTKLCRIDPGFLIWLIDNFNEESEKGFRRAMLDIIQGMESVDPYFNYIKDEFLFDQNIIERKTRTRINLGYSSVIGTIILKLESVENVTEIVSYFFSETYNVRLDGELERSLLKRLIYFMEEDENFIVNLLNKIGKIKAFYRQSEFLTRLLERCPDKLPVAMYFISEQEFHVVRQILAKIADRQVCDLVRDIYHTDRIDSREINYFRNNLNNLRTDSSLAEYFNGIMETIGFKFDQPVFTSEDAKRYEAIRQKRVQANFDMLFDIGGLKQTILEIFKEQGSPISWERMVDIEHSWYETNSMSYNIDVQYDLLTKFIRDYGTLSEEDFITRFSQDEVLRLERIKSKLSNNIQEFNITEEQSNSIRSWCFNVCGSFDFTTLIVVANQDFLEINTDFRKMKLVLFFQKEFGLALPMEFLLNCIEFVANDPFQGEVANLDSLAVLINDKAMFEQRVVDNIIGNSMFSLAMSRHVSYALDHKLNRAYTAIRGYLSGRRDIYPGDQMLEDYISLTNDKDLLMAFCTDICSFKCWAAIDLLMEKGMLSFCIRIAKEYLKTKNDQYLSNAMVVLFKANDPIAIQTYLNYLNEGITISVEANAFANYDVAVDAGIIRDIFAIIYTVDYDRFSFNGGNTLLNIYLANISKRDFEGVKEILTEIQTLVVANTDDNGIFYINTLMDMCEMSYINSLSKPYTFRDALKATDTLLKN